MNKKPDFLRQIVNVVMAERGVSPKSIDEVRKILWETENKFKFSSFDSPRPEEGLKKFIESEYFSDFVNLLKQEKDVLLEIGKRLGAFYGEDLAKLYLRRAEEIIKRSEG